MSYKQERLERQIERELGQSFRWNKRSKIKICYDYKSKIKWRLFFSYCLLYDYGNRRPNREYKAHFRRS